jgi:hypothetical protein
MADTFKTVRPGEPISLAAEWKNIGNDVFQQFRRSRKTHSTPPVILPPLNPTVIKVKNNSGFACNRFDILGLDNPIFTPTAALPEFKRIVAFVGTTPVLGSHRGRFAILREPLDVGAIGQAVISGAFKTTVNVTDASHQYAEVKDDDRVNLQSDWGGSARILWKESGTGTKWAILLLGAGDVGSGQYQGQDLTTVTQNARGWDFDKTYQLPGV